MCVEGRRTQKCHTTYVCVASPQTMRAVPVELGVHGEEGFELDPAAVDDAIARGSGGGNSPEDAVRIVPGLHLCLGGKKSRNVGDEKEGKQQVHPRPKAAKRG